ncbi:MAG: insulinase family protein [Ruminococcaceae bacterium]|nr:insulinase family protein [Oscillospiraceae bacterium]
MEREIEFEASNGVKIYSYRNPSLHGFYISLFVRAGMLYESDAECGITHFLEHVVIRNINKLYGMRLYSELDKRGLEFNASTFSEMVQFYVSGSSEEFDFGSEVISKALEPIILTKDEIDAERKRIKAEIRESDDKTSLASFTSKIAFEGTPLMRSIIGTNGSVDKINLRRLEDYRQAAFSTNNIFFYITGNFTDDNIRRLAKIIDSKQLKTDMPAKDNVAPIPLGFCKRPHDVYVKNADFAMARFSFDIDMQKFSVAEIDLLYDVLLSGYNSKLFVELSEKRGLCYDISGGTERYKNIGTFHFSFELKQKDICDAVGIVVDILSELKTNLLSDEECMKAGYVKNAYMLYDDFRELNFTFSYDNHIMGEKYSSIEDRIERYKSITPERIRDVAKGIFNPENLTLTMKGDKKRVDKEAILSQIKRLI